MKNAVTRACAWVSAALLTYAPLSAAQTVEIIAGQRDYIDVPGSSVNTWPQSIAIGADGNLHVLDYGRNLVRFRLSDGTVSSLPGIHGEPRLDFYGPYSVAFDAGGVAHALTSEGLFQVDTAAGTKTLLGLLPNPGMHTAFGPDGTFYWQSWSDHRIRARLPSGEIRIVAGTGTAGYGGDNGPAELATLNWPQGLAVAPNGDLFVADERNNRVRRISASTGSITTFMGTGAVDFTADGLPAAESNVGWPNGIAFDSAGNLFVATANRIRRVDVATGVVTTVAGNGSFVYSGDGGPATAAGMGPGKIAVDPAGNIFFHDGGNKRIRVISATTGIVTTAVGNGQEWCGENMPARAACFGFVRGIDIEANGNLLIADEYAHRVRRVSAQTGNVATLMNPVAIPGDPVATQIPVGVEHDPAGTVYVTTESHRVWKLDANGAPTFFAGTGQQGFSGDNGTAGIARLNTPADIAFDSAGNAFIADTFNNRIRRVDAVTRVITTYAGNGTGNGAPGDGGSATAATVSYPQTVEIDPQGNLVIGESGGCVRRVDRVTRVITRIFGSFACATTYPPGQTQFLQMLPAAPAIAFDRMGNLWVFTGISLWRMEYATGQTTRVQPAGGGVWRVEGRSITTPSSLEFDSAGRLLVGDKFEMRVFRISGLPNTTPDATPPTITPNVSGPAGANGWHVGDVSVTFSVSDAESPVTSQTGCGASAVTQDTSGTTFTCTATSTGGTATGTVEIRRDATAPTLEFDAVSPAANANGWNGGDVSIAFSTADALSGVASTSLPSPLAFTNEGVGMTQSVTVTDNAGNSASFESPGVNIDKTPPVVTPDVAGAPGGNGWYVGDVQVDWSINEVPASIESSTGCGTTSVTLDTAGSTFTCTVTSAGGTTSSSTTVRRDATAPTLVFGTPAPAPNAFGWYNHDTSIPFTVDDVTSGVASTSQPSPLTLANEGVGLSRSVSVTDAAGNSASFTTTPINIDKTGPVVAPVVTGTLGNGDWYVSDVTVSWSILEMPESITFVNGCETNTVTTDTDGVMFGCVVNSQGGGIGMPQWIKRDTTPATVQWGAFSPVPNANGWNRTNVSVPFTASDALSGVAGSSASPLVISAEGAGVTGQVTVTDRAGNVATISSPPRNIDKTAPVVSLTSPANGASFGFYQDVEADYSCTDVSLLSCTAPNPDGAMVNTRTAGARTFKVTAKDSVNFTTAVTHGFTVAPTFNFDGFLGVAPSPTPNLVSRGALVPIRWKLPDGNGGFVSNTASFTSASVTSLSCSGAPVPYTEVGSGAAGISYDAGSQTFTYNWQTGASWSGCRRISIRLKDNVSRELIFRFQ